MDDDASAPVDSIKRFDSEPQVFRQSVRSKIRTDRDFLPASFEPRTGATGRMTQKAAVFFSRCRRSIYKIKTHDQDSQTGWGPRLRSKADTTWAAHMLVDDNEVIEVLGESLIVFCVVFVSIVGVVKLAERSVDVAGPPAATPPLHTYLSEAKKA